MRVLGLGRRQEGKAPAPAGKKPRRSRVKSMRHATAEAKVRDNLVWGDLRYAWITHIGHVLPFPLPRRDMWLG